MKTRQDYPDKYSFRADNLWKELKEDDDTSSVKVISYFKPRARGEPEITGVVYKPLSTSYELEIPITKVFALLKEKMATKTGLTRKKMLDIPEYQIYDYGALLEYVRSEWMEGNRGNVLISKKEYSMIAPDKTKGKKK